MPLPVREDYPSDYERARDTLRLHCPTLARLWESRVSPGPTSPTCARRLPAASHLAYLYLRQWLPGVSSVSEDPPALLERMGRRARSGYSTWATSSADELRYATTVSLLADGPQAEQIINHLEADSCQVALWGLLSDPSHESLWRRAERQCPLDTHHLSRVVYLLARSQDSRQTHLVMERVTEELLRE